MGGLWPCLDLVGNNSVKKFTWQLIHLYREFKCMVSNLISRRTLEIRIPTFQTMQWKHTGHAVMGKDNIK